MVDSIIPYPVGTTSRAKYYFWRGVYPFFAHTRDFLVSLRIIHHNVRQRYLLGALAPQKTVEGLLAHLESVGFGNHFVAWIDEGELFGLRRLEGFERQYHVRIFRNGDVRGHYEFTPESHPLRHFKEHGFEDRREEFLAFLGDWIVPAAADADVVNIDM